MSFRRQPAADPVGTRTGTEVMKPLAVPVIFAWLRERELKKEKVEV